MHQDAIAMDYVDTQENTNRVKAVFDVTVHLFLQVNQLCYSMFNNGIYKTIHNSVHSAYKIHNAYSVIEERQLRQNRTDTG